MMKVEFRDEPEIFMGNMRDGDIAIITTKGSAEEGKVFRGWT